MKNLMTRDNFRNSVFERDGHISSSVHYSTLIDGIEDALELIKPEAIFRKEVLNKKLNPLSENTKLDILKQTLLLII